MEGHNHNSYRSFSGIPIGLTNEVTSQPHHPLQRHITQNTPTGGILSNDPKNTENPNNPVLDSRTGLNPVGFHIKRALLPQKTIDANFADSEDHSTQIARNWFKRL